MKRKLLLSLSAALLSTGLMAGGINTNTNQSAAYVRMLARNASLGIDAVYFNPAGLTKLGNGFHLSLNNQTIFQTKDVVNNYKYLNGSPNAKYTGIVKAPVFPGVYAAYKMDKLAFSFGFNPVGGGGGATYDKGLPSFEMPISDLIPLLASTTGPMNYKADINFEGTSVYFGYQFGISYEVNPSISLFAGVRTVTAKNTYKGYIKDIMINPKFTATPPIPGVAALSFNGSFVKPADFGSKMQAYYTAGAKYYTAVATQMTDASASLDPMIAGGIGGLTPAQAATAGYITATQKAQIEGGLTAIGQPVSLTIVQAKGAFTGAATQATGGAAQLSGGAAQMGGLGAKTADVEVDAIQKGTGYTPIFGANLTIAEKLTLAIKYEMLTKIELTNETKVDGSGLFPNGGKTRADMPAMLAIGVAYPLTSKLNASLSYTYYFDKSANYGKKNSAGVAVKNSDVIDKNYFELALGLEYNITDKFLVSAGYLLAKTGVSEAYQNDLSYSLTSNTVGFGGRYQITKGIGVNLGTLNTFYSDSSKSFSHTLGTTVIPVKEDYSKTTWMVAVGVDIKIGK